MLSPSLGFAERYLFKMKTCTFSISISRWLALSPGWSDPAQGQRPPKTPGGDQSWSLARKVAIITVLSLASWALILGFALAAFRLLRG